MPLSKDRNTPYREATQVAYPMAANAKIFAGALVVLDGGLAGPGRAATGLVAVGRAEAFADNTGGANGAARVLVRRLGAFRFDNLVADAVTAAEVGGDCFIVDDATVARTNGGNPATRSRAGRVIEVSDDGVWVEFR